MRFWAAAGLLFLFSLQSQAEVRTVQAGDVDGLIQAVLDANANPSEVMVVVVKGTGTFEFTDDYQDSGFALPPLQGARLAILIEKADVTFLLDPTTEEAKSTAPPTQSLGFFRVNIDEAAVDAFCLVLIFRGLDLFGFFADPPTPKITQSTSADGPVIQADGSGVVLSAIRVNPNSINYAIESQDSRVVADGIVADGRGVDAEATSSGAAPGSSLLTDFLDEVNDAYSAAQGGSRQKAFVAELDASIEELKRLSSQATFAFSNTFISAPGDGIFVDGPGSVYVEDSYIQVVSPFSEPNISVVNLSGAASRKAPGGSSPKTVPLGTIRVVNSVIEHSHAASEAIFVDQSHLELDGVTLFAEDGIELTSSEASAQVYRSILGTLGGEGFVSERRGNCDIDAFDAGGFTSLGYNLSADDTCPLSHPTDRQNSDPKITAPADGELVPGLAANSPAIDGGPSGLVNGELPCGTTDVLGMARPQDGDGDGTVACDVGALEVASRGGIDGRQSGAYYDLGRNGEGVFVEMLSATSALVYLFSYTPAGEPFWALGVGQVIGNGIVIRKQDFLTTRGAVFGEGFDPADVEFIPFADISINFPDCRNTTKKGSLSITPNDELGFGPVLSTTERLTFILDCGTRAAMGPGFSGSFFDPSHDGEGIIVQVISADTVVVQWFTYDAEGNQYWIQGVGTLSGGKVTVDEALAFRGPRYGPNYDAGDLEQFTWGTIMIEFDGCDAATLVYESVIEGFGMGEQSLQRLTSLRGVDCS